MSGQFPAAAGGAEPEPERGLSGSERGMLAMLNAHEAGGGALNLERLAPLAITRSEAEAALGTVGRSMLRPDGDRPERVSTGSAR